MRASDGAEVVSDWGRAPADGWLDSNPMTTPLGLLVPETYGPWSGARVVGFGGPKGAPCCSS